MVPALPGGISDIPEPPSNPRLPILVGALIIFLAFGGLGTWAAVAPLSSAVVAPGTVMVESNRKEVQHFEGGIVEEILVREGDQVKMGQVLVRLKPTQAKATAAMVSNQYRNFQAMEARLIAERDGDEIVRFPPDLLAVAETDPEIREFVDGQLSQFEERRKSLEGQIGLLESRIAQLRQEIEGLKVQKASKERQVNLYNEELVGLRELYEKGWYSRTRILAMERELARLEGEIGGDVSNMARAEKGIGEAELQIIQTRQKFREEVVSQLRDVQAQLADLRERSTVATDILERTAIRAPQDGVVQNLKLHTTGGVVRPGDVLMEIVPSDDKLIIEAQVSPLDIDNVRTGQMAEVQFSAFKSRNLPVIEGEVILVSPDRLVDERQNQAYYAARVRVPEKELHKLGDKHRLQAGMPATVLIQTGERTVLDYFLKPLEDAMTRAMVEE